MGKKGHQGFSIDCVFKCSIYDNLNAYHIFMCQVMALHIRLINKLWYRHKYLWIFSCLLSCGQGPPIKEKPLVGINFYLSLKNKFHYIQRKCIYVFMFWSTLEGISLLFIIIFFMFALWFHYRGTKFPFSTFDKQKQKNMLK